MVVRIWCDFNTPLEKCRRARARNEASREEEEAVEEEQKCRLCLEGVDDGPLVQPCACRGSAKLAHKHCLERWRRESPKEDAAYRCGQCMDHYRDALSIELLKARLQTERTDGEATISTLVSLATELQSQGMYDEAMPLFREALKVRRETLGGRHPNTLTSINNLGVLLEARGDLPAAGLLLREALEVRCETLGDQHPHTLTSINNLGRLHGKHRPRWMCGVRRYAVGIWERWYTMYSM